MGAVIEELPFDSEYIDGVILQGRKKFFPHTLDEAADRDYTEHAWIEIEEEFTPEYLRQELRKYHKATRYLKLQKVLLRLFTSPRLLYYFVSSVIKKPKNIRQYVSNVSMWYYMLLDTKKR